ncbi:hypothetical protein [Halopseudomonas salegens]|uniref:MFS transporter n=1 Tax=Halopseudomonas salegens TaxID=1434072 RepID=A0A1H2EHX6_9GAMM|nr:hypothetical protein [Halopseudomonas salegens]SDT94573.1 hypothetical protein SAMN05216210_0732 [Halopseudomonas salegens]
MDSAINWKALQRNWRMQTGVSLILPIALVWLLRDSSGSWEEAAIPLFVLGLVSMFLTLWRFSPYKRALVAVGNLSEQVNAADTESTWANLHHQQMLGLLNAKIPGWIGMLHFVCTGELTPLILLVLASQGLLLLYRPPSAWVNASQA